MADFNEAYFNEVNENYGGTNHPDDYGGYLDVSYANALAQQQEYEQRAADQAAADYIASDDKYRDYGPQSGVGAPGTSYEFSPSGSSGVKSLLNKLTKNSKGNLDWAKIAMLMYGAKTLADGKRPAPKLGFQGTIPKYQATSNLMTAPPGRRKAGAYGINYGGDPTYTKMAEGGLATLAEGRYLQGETDGMADQIPAQIGEDQPAALSHGEFVIPADVVSHLGNGNSDAGAQKLYDMMEKIREARTGNKEQGKKINPDSFMPGGLAKAYADGGSVLKFNTGGTTPTSGEQTLSTWAGDYVTDMLGKGKALSEKPYEAYTGQLTAAPSALQTTAFSNAANLSVPSSVGTAAQTAGDIATKAQGINYTPTTFSNQFQAPTPYQTTNFTSGTFGGEQAQQYMNPYLQASLNPQLAEARRQADITEQQNKAAMTKAGAFGGGRQAILTAEGQRNLGTNLAGITGKGYDTAFQNAMSQFNADQARNMQAQQASEQSKQFGATQGMTAADMMAKYGMSAQQAQEAARQFGADLGIKGLQTGLQAAQTQGNLGISAGQLDASNLQQQLAAGAAERAIDAEQVAADKAQFEEARANPYKQIQFQQSLLDKLPIQTTNYNTVTPSMLETLSGNMTKMNELLSRLGLLETPPKP